MTTNTTFEELRSDYARQRLLPLPIAGAIAWAVAGVLGTLLPTRPASIAMFISVGVVFWLAVLVGRVIGEPIIGHEKKSNELDRLLLAILLMGNLVWAIAIPFYIIEPSSLPLSLGILTGLEWVPLSWIIRHWVGLFHGTTRTVLVVTAWYVFPSHRFVVIPAIIVVIYLISIYVLATRQERRVGPNNGADTD